jgi:hypothetical protein
MEINKLKQELTNYLDKPNTHRSLKDAAKDFPVEYINSRPDGISYSFWEMLEHIRISQFDMLDFMRNPGYKEMKWPDEYWPEKGSVADKKMWDESLKKFENDLKAIKEIVNEPSTDLYAVIAHGSGQTIFREILQIIDHNSYHTGEFILMRKAMEIWDR